jgi:outer membrane immunogenic protein
LAKNLVTRWQNQRVSFLYGGTCFYALLIKIKLMMKMIFTITVLLTLALPSQAQVRVAPFLAYGDQLGLWGLGAYTEILLNEKMSVTPNFTQYFPKDFDNVPRRSAWELNANLNYYFVSGEVGSLYGLAGLNYTHMRLRTETAFADEVENDNNVGLNVGLGTMVRLNDLIMPFVEAKYTAGGYSELSVMIGVKFDLGDNTLADDY